MADRDRYGYPGAQAWRDQGNWQFVQPGHRQEGGRPDYNQHSWAHTVYRGGPDWRGQSPGYNPRGMGEGYIASFSQYQGGNQGFVPAAGPVGGPGYGGTWGGPLEDTYGPGGAYTSGPHAGRGPKGYRRSDERIREDVCEALTRHGGVDASDIDVTVENGEVTLRGAVDDRQQKRMAEDAADDVPGVTDVHNELRIGRESSQRAPAEGTTRGATSGRRTTATAR